jgi:hypothetical protein
MKSYPPPLCPLLNWPSVWTLNLDAQLGRSHEQKGDPSDGVVWDSSDPGNSDPNQRCVAHLHLLLGVEANGCCFGR